MSDQAKSVSDLKKAVKNSSKLMMWAPFGQTKEGDPVGGYVEVYKTHLWNLMKAFQLPTSAWDQTIKCFYRIEDETGVIYIEGFRTF